MQKIVPNQLTDPLKGASFGTHNNLNSLPQRQLTIEDIRSIQTALGNFADQNKDHPHKGVYDFYRWCVGNTTASKAEVTNALQRIPTSDHEALQLGVFNSWRKSFLADHDQIIKERPALAALVPILRAEKEPKTISELRSLLSRHTIINNLGPIQYQDGAGNASLEGGNFVHCHMDRHSQYKYEQPERGLRIYLNPHLEAVANVASHLCLQSVKQNFPLYLKLADASFHPNAFLAETLGRKDQIIILTNTKDAPRILESIAELVKSNPKLFDGRTAPTMCAQVSPGVGIGDDPSKSLGPGKTFNSIRGNLFDDVFQEATRKIVLGNPEHKLPTGKTIREVLVNALEALKDRFKEDRKQGFPVKSRPFFDPVDILRIALQCEFDPERLRRENLPNNLINGIIHSVATSTHKILPHIKAEVVLHYAQQSLKSIASRYLVDPNDLARNLPSSTNALGEKPTMLQEAILPKIHEGIRLGSVNIGTLLAMGTYRSIFFQTSDNQLFGIGRDETGNAFVKNVKSGMGFVLPEQQLGNFVLKVGEPFKVGISVTERVTLIEALPQQR